MPRRRWWRKAATKVPDEYIIGSGDQLSIFVYRNPDLSEGGVAVRPDGKISTPLIEDIVAAGKTPTQLAREIEQRLTKYIQDPNVTVIVRELRRAARPAGAGDRRSDRSDCDPVPRSHDSAGCHDRDQGADEIRRRQPCDHRSPRCRDGKQQTIKVRLSDLIKYGDISQNIEMAPGDTLIVPQSWF